MKKLFFFSVALLIVGAMGSAMAQDGQPVQSGNLYYFLNHADHTATVTNGYGGYIDAEAEYDELRYTDQSIWIPATIYAEDNTGVWSEYRVTAIGKYAFNWASARSVTIPNSVTFIDEYAFYWMQALREIKIPSSVQRIAANNFIGCGSLKRVIFEESAETLEIEVASEEAIPFQASPVNTFKMMRPFDSQGYNIMRYKPIEKLFIGKNITEIADYTFADLSSSYTQIFAYGEQAPKCDTLAFAGQEIVEVYIKDELRPIYEFMELILMHNFADSAAVREAGYYDGFWGLFYYGTAGEFGGSSDYYEYQEAYYNADRGDVYPWDMMTQGNEEKDSLRIVICDGRYLWLERYAYDKVRVVQPKMKYNGWYEQPFNATYLGGKYVIPDSVDFPIERYDESTGSHNRTEYVRCAVEEIGYDAFVNSELSEIVLPQTLKLISTQAFMNCRNLKHIDFPDNIEYIGYGAFCDPGRYSDNPGGLEGKVVLPKNLKYLGDCAFRTCEYLTEIEFPAALDTIQGYCFWGCSRLNNVVVPGTVKAIMMGAFSACFGLDKITLEEGVEFLDMDLFPACPFSELIIPASVTTIMPGMLERIGNEQGEPTLTHLVVKEGNKVYDSRNGCNAIIETASNTLIAGTGASFIPETVDTIASNAFTELSIRSITLPKNLKKIKQFAFNAWIGRLVSEIDEPAGVLEVDGFNIFNRFDEPATLTVYVPAGTKEKYLTDEGWSEYASKIVEEEPVTIEDITPAATTDVSFGAVAEDIDLTNAVIDNLYVTCDTLHGDRYDTERQAFVFETTVLEAAIAALMETDGLRDVVQNIFTGIVLQVPAGEGSITVTAHATEHRAVAVTIENMESNLNDVTLPYTTIYTNQPAKGEVVINYNVTADAHVYIYGAEMLWGEVVAMTPAKFAKRHAPQEAAYVAEQYVSIYGVKAEGIGTGIEEVEAQLSAKTGVQKVLMDGQIYIIKDGKRYTTTGIEVR